jgi:hypothetical protein
MTNSFDEKHHLRGSSWKFVALIAIVLIALTVSVFGAATFVSGLVPDWNQPYHYVSPNGPGGDPNRGNPPNQFTPTDQWNDWCAPTSAANLAGHWTDVRGIPVADTTAYPNSTVAWGAGPSWKDYLADSNRPPAQAAAGTLPSSTTDIGWYMDCNRGILWDRQVVKKMGGYYYGDPDHDGTLLRNMHVGLQLFLNNRFSLSSNICWRTGTRGTSYFAGVSPSGLLNMAPFPDEATAFAEVKSEIDSNRTLIITFQHWSVTPVGTGAAQGGLLTNEAAYGYSNYFFATPYTDMPNAEDEYWNLWSDGETLGHAVTCVGYIVGGDPADPWAGPPWYVTNDWVIVHDNWASTPRNVAVPLGHPPSDQAPGGTFNQYYVANTTAVPWPTQVKFVTCLVPDWNQPYDYTMASVNLGPGPDPHPNVCDQWNAWCAPSSAANLAGHWADCFGAPVADTTAFDSIPFPGSTVLFGFGASWQDYLADPNGPGVQFPPCALPVAPTDIGWYMDTDRSGYCLNGINDAHCGTYLKDIHVGLGLFLNSLFGQPAGPGWDTGTQGKQWAGGINALGNPAVIHPNEASAFGEVVQEINRNHTLLLSFDHWVVADAGLPVAFDGTNTEAALGASYYNWGATPLAGVTNAEDEYWNFYDEYYNASNNLGHTVTCVGYIPAGDPLDQGMALGLGPTDWVIVHDNWPSTPRNVIIPYGSPGGFNANWVANTTAEPSRHLSITNIVKVANDVFIDFTTIPSAMHHLEWTSEMTNTTWTVAVSNMTFVVGTRRVTNTVSSSVTNRFYRIRASY